MNDVAPRNNSHVFAGCDTEKTVVYSLASGAVAAYTARSPGKQTPNEDCAALIDCGERAAVPSKPDDLTTLLFRPVASSADNRETA